MSYLDFLSAHNHNFFRLWHHEQSCWIYQTERPYFCTPLPFRRNGPGNALDGKPKFDLTRFNQDYFDRLRSRVVAARDRGIYVAVMLSNGFSVARSKGGSTKGNPWRGHPFHRQNNVNGIDGDPHRRESGEGTHELAVPQVTAIQERYVKKVVDTVNDLDNVLYEISNESRADSDQWQYHMIRLIKSYEATKPKLHPVGMSVEYPDGSNQDLLDSPADWISHKEHQGDALINKGKVVLDDTDHWYGIGGDRIWAWKRFMAGTNPIFMDGYDIERRVDLADFPKFVTAESRWTSVRLNLAYILNYSRRVDLKEMCSKPELASTGHCLANLARKGAKYITYLPEVAHGEVDVDLSGSAGVLSTEWLNPTTGLVLRGSNCAGQRQRRLASPFGADSVLFITNISGSAAN